MGKHLLEGRVSYVVQQFIPSEPKPGPLAHWADRLATRDRDEAYALATGLGRCRVHEFEVVRLQSGRLATRERKGSPFRVDASGGEGVQSGGEGVQSA